MKKLKEKPTAAELEILAVLWERGSATVKEVQEVVSSRGESLSSESFYVFS